MPLQSKEILPTHADHYAFEYGERPHKNKLIFFDDQEGSHYTLLFNDEDKILDLHKTTPKASERYASIFKLRYYTVHRLFVPLLKIQVRLLKKYWLSQTITIGKLIRLHALIVPMQNSEVADKIIEKRRKRKYRVASEISIDTIDKMFYEPEQLHHLKSQTFAVYSRRGNKHKMLGTILKDFATDTLYFVSLKNHELFGKEMMQGLLEIVRSSDFEFKDQFLSFLERVKQP